ncbi:MAG: hypothetical protein U5L11_16150 [Arhodomonas sp.]|nr:hypothetical protein [Arhodomonas sp.]
MRTLLAVLLLLHATVAAAVEAVDDDGRRIDLPGPADRIISLAPHATEMLFAIGAGERIVGTVSYSDHPPAARQIPRVAATTPSTTSASSASNQTWLWPGRAATGRIPWNGFVISA